MLFCLSTVSDRYVVQPPDQLVESLHFEMLAAIMIYILDKSAIADCVNDV